MILNLPTAPGLNGTYHLIRFGTGPANASGFTLGTVPALAWNQTGTLRINRNDLDYVITAIGDATPPTLAGTLPANNDTTILADAGLVATFDESIVAGTGSIELRRTSDSSLVESFNVATSTRLTFRSSQLVIQPATDLPTGQYYVLIPAGAVRDTSGNNYAGISSNTAWRFTVSTPPVLFTDSGSPANPLWSAILPTLNVQSPDQGPVLGSVINVNNAAVERGLYGNRPILVPSQRIHVACNTSTTSFANFTRWFQTDGNTHVLRVFVDDENTATTRPGPSSHTEAFNSGGWDYSENMTYEWTGHFTGARVLQGFICFQLMNSDNEWAVQLSLGASGTLNVNNRTGTDRPVTNPDGSARRFDSQGFDVRVLDDGLNYRVYIDGDLYASSTYSRPTGTTTFRWGMYFGSNNLNPPADYNLLLVSGVQIKSWPGNLTTATTTRTKANNTTNLDNEASWVGGVDPGLHDLALWNNTVTAANTTTLASYQQWAGLRITNPGGPVTINGSAILGLDEGGLDMSTTTQNLTVNCPVQMTAPSTWNVAPGRTATFNGIISGYPDLTIDGVGTVQLNAANTFSGDTHLDNGTLVVNDNSALSAGRLLFNGGILSNTSSSTLANDVSLNAGALVNVSASQTLTLSGVIAGTSPLTKTGMGTLTLSGANSYTGATNVSTGTLALGRTAALLSTSSLTLAGGTLLQPTLDGVIIRAPITVGASGTTATISAPINNPGSGISSTLTLRSALTGSGNITFSSSVNQPALSTIFLGTPATYAGTTLLDTAGTTATQIIVRLGVNNALPVSTVLTIDGQPGAGTGRFAELNLNGFNQQLAGLTNTARSLRFQRIVNSNISAPATLTINNSANYTFSGNLGSETPSGSLAAGTMPGSTNGNNFGLTKSGPGTFTLTGSNTYRGDTTVHGGTLTLGTANTGNNASTITLAPTGALLRLTYAGTDTVARLFIGPDQKPAGTYGHSTTGASNGGLGVGAMDAFFAAGPGTLTVSSSPPLSGYATWASTNAPATGSNPNADEDSDGVANALEYILGGTRLTRDLTKLPTLSTSGGFITFTFLRDQTSIDGTTALFIETGTSLTTWNPHVVPIAATGPVNPGVAVVKNAPAPGTDTITLTLPSSTLPGSFIRLRVTTN